MGIMAIVYPIRHRITDVILRIQDGKSGYISHNIVGKTICLVRKALFKVIENELDVMRNVRLRPKRWGLFVILVNLEHTLFQTRYNPIGVVNGIGMHQHWESQRRFIGIQKLHNKLQIFGEIRLTLPFYKRNQPFAMIVRQSRFAKGSHI